MSKKSVFATFLFVATAAAAAPAPLIDEGAMKEALQNGKVKVAKLERRLGPPDVPDGSFAQACRNWRLTEAQMLSFLTRASAISPEELHSSYAVVPCQYSGEITIDGKAYQFSLNAGSFAVIRGATPDRVALFGCKAACRDVFRVAPAEG